MRSSFRLALRGQGGGGARAGRGGGGSILETRREQVFLLQVGAERGGVGGAGARRVEVGGHRSKPGEEGYSCWTLQELAHRWPRLHGVVMMQGRAGWCCLAVARRPPPVQCVGLVDTHQLLAGGLCTWQPAGFELLGSFPAQGRRVLIPGGLHASSSNGALATSWQPGLASGGTVLAANPTSTLPRLANRFVSLCTPGGRCQRCCKQQGCERRPTGPHRTNTVWRL